MQASSRSQRIHERYECDIDAEVVREGLVTSAQVRDISLGGVLFVSDVTFEYGDTLTLRFQIPGLKRVSELEAIVRWVGHAGTGVQFLKIRAYEVWGLNQLFRAAQAA